MKPLYYKSVSSKCAGRPILTHHHKGGRNETKWMRWVWRNGGMKFVVREKTGETPWKTYPDLVSSTTKPIWRDRDANSVISHDTIYTYTHVVQYKRARERETSRTPTTNCLPSWMRGIYSNTVESATFQFPCLHVKPSSLHNPKSAFAVQCYTDSSVEKKTEWHSSMYLFALLYAYNNLTFGFSG